MLPGKRKLWAIAGGLLAATVIAGGAGIAVATGAAESEQPITGTALEKASAAALAHTGNGTVTDTEVGDEEGFYEVEVRLDDGSEVDVHLDADFNVTNAEPETADEGADADGG